MSKKANPTVIGAFVIAGVALIAIAAALFGGAELLAAKTRAVSYFPGSIKGLRVGANVLARGVRVGYVTDIQLLGDIDTLETQVQVTMEIFPEAFQLTQEGKVIGTVAEFGQISDVVDAGLRAQLDVESFVTGQLLIELDFYPQTPPLFRGEDPPYYEIPTIPSDIQQVLEGVQQFVTNLQETVDVEALAQELAQAVSGLSKLVNSGDLTATLAGINRLVNDDETQALANNLDAAVNDLRTTLGDARNFFRNTDAGISEITDSLAPVVANLDSALKQTEQVMSSAQRQLRTDSEISYELATTLNEVQNAARSLRLLADFLERQPEALVRGKRSE